MMLENLTLLGVQSYLKLNLPGFSDSIHFGCGKK